MDRELPTVQDHRQHQQGESMKHGPNCYCRSCMHADIANYNGIEDEEDA
jgi:hypothetical protein